MRGLRVSLTSTDAFELRDRLGPSSLRGDTRRLGSRGFGGGLVQRGLGHRRGRAAAESPRTRTSEPIAVAGDGDDVGLGEHRVERGSPSAFHEHDAGEEPLEHRAEVGSTGAHALGERTRADRHRRRRARPGGERVGDENESARVAGLDVLERAPGRVAAFEHDGLERVAQSGGHRRFGPGLELDVVGERARDAVQVGERLGAGPGARLAQREVEGVESRTPARGLGFGLAPALVGVGEARLGRGHPARPLLLRVGQCRALGCHALLGRFHLGELRLERRRLVVDLGELASQGVGVGDQRFDHTLVGGGSQLALEAALLLDQQRAQAPAPLAHRLGPHERFGGVVVAERGERVLDVEHAAVELSQPRPHEPLLLGVLVPRVVQTFEPGLAAGDLVAGEVEADGAQLGLDTAVPAGGVGLLLERPELPADLAHEVVEA